MCGFTGFLTASGALDNNQTLDVLRYMGNAIIHRGPDSDGYWTDPASGVALAHRRLAIVDLSPAGHQPMLSACERYVIAFNGEVYNHHTLRRELDQAGAVAAWRGHSDTETLLAGFAYWGIAETVARCIGMFAFAVWDKQRQLLTLGRDRFGEKPLYYGWQGNGSRRTFLFGSELKALKQHPAFEPRINRDALCLQMRYNCIPAPFSIYEGIAKLPAGHLLTISSLRPEPVLTQYWSLSQVAVAGAQLPFAGSDKEAVDQLEVLLNSAISQQMMADVPLGAFLSGGIDSTTVVALMQQQSSRPVKTFTIGFNEEGYNEAVHAKAVAHHLGTEHTELYVSPQQALEVVPKLPSLYCEPFSDSSQIPTYLVSALARQHVTVSLSGDAGDELFAGYNRYVMTNSMWGKLSGIPLPLRKLAAGGIRSISPHAWDKLLHSVRHVIPRHMQMSSPGDKLHKAASVIGERGVDELYMRLLSHWVPSEIVIDGHEPLGTQIGMMGLTGLDPVQRMMAMDAVGYMSDDVLTKVDRAAMGVSLETRVPFLDHRVAEFAWKLPLHMKLRDGVGKWILRQVLYRHVPQALMERPKMGFGVPIDDWLRGPLRDWAENLLDERRLRQEGYFHLAPIRKKWHEHLSGRKNWQYHLWDVLMFQAWLEHVED